MGSCHVEDEPSDLWRECAIIDVSTLGVGIELCHPDPVELLGLWHDGELRLNFSRRISVRFQLSPSLDLTVAGEVRNAGSGPDGIVRAGIEFVDLTEIERSMVDRLVREASVSRIEALGQPQTIADPVPVLSELPESLVEVLGRPEIAEALGWQEIADPVPELRELRESRFEALGQRQIDKDIGWQEIVDPVPVLSELPESRVEPLGQQQTIADPVPTHSELARMGGKLVFMTLRVIGSDVLDLVCRLPAPARMLKVAGHARLSLHEIGHGADQPVNLATVHPESPNIPS
jgi:PilZ domain